MKNSNVKRFSYLDMYQMAKNQQLSGWTYWPIPALMKKSFKLIDDKLMTDNEEPVFAFVARTNKNYFDSQDGDNQQNQQMYGNGYDNMYQKRPNVLFTILSFPFKLIFGPLLKPFDMTQMWTAFVMTNKNKLYFAHYSFPFYWASDTGTMIMLPDDIHINQNNTVSNPFFGDLDIMSVRGNQKMKLMWTRNSLHKIYAGITNNMNQNDRKREDDDGNTFYS